MLAKKAKCGFLASGDRPIWWNGDCDFVNTERLEASVDWRASAYGGQFRDMYFSSSRPNRGVQPTDGSLRGRLPGRDAKTYAGAETRETSVGPRAIDPTQAGRTLDSL
jgi:hypothetical protein